MQCLAIHSLVCTAMQVVNDPWDVLIKEDVAEDHAWVTKEELGNYLADQNLLALAHRML